MGSIVTSTADILAILGGATTLIGAVFAAIRLSRCQRVSCCWGALSLENKPLATPPPPAPQPPQLERAPVCDERRCLRADALYFQPPVFSFRGCLYNDRDTQCQIKP